MGKLLLKAYNRRGFVTSAVATSHGSHETSPWPQFIDDAPTAQKYEAEPGFAAVKRAIVDEYGQENLTEAWLKTCERLARVTQEIKEKGQQIIPDVEFDDIRNGRVTSDAIDRIRDTGCLIVRNVIPEPEATGYLQDLKGYVSRNPDRFSGFPKGHPSMYNLYSTPSQNALRTRPELLQMMKWMNSLWDFSADEEHDDASPDPLIYADGFRIRTPKSEFLGLGPHIDAGGLVRWGDAVYRSVYSEIFSGHPERHNSYAMRKRKDANQALYGGDHPSTVLRAFQGWTALSRNGPREGTIILYPFVSIVIAYVLLRPFFKPPSGAKGSKDREDPREWAFDPSGSWFPGTQKQLGQSLSPSSHPHMHLQECMIPVPALNAGDTVWWHSDMIHAVEPEHIGDDVASVAYIAATPTTAINKVYTRRQYDLMAKGLPPPDFSFGVDESKLDGYEGFKGNEEFFRKLMGY